MINEGKLSSWLKTSVGTDVSLVVHNVLSLIKNQLQIQYRYTPHDGYDAVWSSPNFNFIFFACDSINNSSSKMKRIQSEIFMLQTVVWSGSKG